MRASGAGGQGVNTADSAVSKLFYEDDIGFQHPIIQGHNLNY